VAYPQAIGFDPIDVVLPVTHQNLLVTDSSIIGELHYLTRSIISKFRVPEEVDSKKPDEALGQLVSLVQEDHKDAVRIVNALSLLNSTYQMERFIPWSRVLVRNKCWLECAQLQQVKDAELGKEARLSFSSLTGGSPAYTLLCTLLTSIH
jgi:hypothetical protein